MSGRAVPVPGVPAGTAGHERILQRAIELAGDGPLGVAELAPSDLRQVAGELEVPSWALSAALAEHRVVADLPPAGRLSRLVGPVAVVGWRQVGADPDRAEAVVSAWLEDGYALRVRRLGDGTMVATRKPGVAGSIARVARSVRGGRELAGTKGEVRAAVVGDGGEPGRSVVSVLVDLRARRRAAIGGGATIGGLGVAGAAALVAETALGLPGLAAGVPLSLAAGGLVAAVHHRGVVRVVTEEVEVALDGVARRQPPAGVLRELARSVTRGIGQWGTARPRGRHHQRRRRGPSVTGGV